VKKLGYRPRSSRRLFRKLSSPFERIDATADKENQLKTTKSKP